MDEFNEKLTYLKSAKKFLKIALSFLDEYGLDWIEESIGDAMDALDDEIERADEDAVEEARLEEDAMTRAYFADVMGPLDRMFSIYG